MKKNRVLWKSNNTPFSPKFEDIYFSTENGLEESSAVFLDGIEAPLIWKDKTDFTICELGFGTGLNLFNTLKLWVETTDSNQHLTYIATEKYPLAADDIRRAVFWEELKQIVDAFLIGYPEKYSSLFDGRVTVRLLFGDSVAELSEQNFVADAWYLDGFAPSKNPQMWSDDLFSEIAKYSRSGTMLATFTAAGFVRRGLADRGFEIIKRAGYGKKREMLSGIFQK